MIPKNYKTKDISRSKKEIIQKDGMLEFIDEELGFEDVGGLNNLKDLNFLRKNKIFSENPKKNR